MTWFGCGENDPKRSQPSKLARLSFSQRLDGIDRRGRFRAGLFGQALKEDARAAGCAPAPVIDHPTGPASSPPPSPPPRVASIIQITVVNRPSGCWRRPAPDEPAGVSQPPGRRFGSPPASNPRSRRGRRRGTAGASVVRTGGAGCPFQQIASGPWVAQNLREPVVGDQTCCFAFSVIGIKPVPVGDAVS